MISTPLILRSGIKRFIPGVLIFFGGALVFAASRKDMTIGPAQMLGVTQLTLSMFAGYVATLAIARKRLARDARVDGRRSTLAGVAATCVQLGLGVLHGSPIGRPLNCLLAVAAGAIATSLLFAPWMGTGARLAASADDLDVLDAAESVLADLPAGTRVGRTTRPTKTPRHISPVRAD